MEKVGGYLLSALFLVVVAGQCTQIVMRSFLDLPVYGLEDVMLFPALWLYFLGAVNASRENTHIRANVIGSFLKTPHQRLLHAALTECLTLMVGCVMVYWSWEFAWYSARVGKVTPVLYFPTVFADVSLLVCLVAMMGYTAVRFVGHLRCFAAAGPVPRD